MLQSRLTHNVIAVALACLTFFTTAAQSQTFELSLEEGRVAARQAVLSRQFQLARDLALALIDADPDDRAALIVLAAVQPQLGDGRKGRRAGVRAFRLSNSDTERYEAARLTALAAANEERYTLSQIWLRRAAINAPDDRALQQTQRDYRGIRNLNPWSVNLNFSVTPSNNVNGGSSTDCLVEIPTSDGTPSFCLGQLSGDAQALSGITATGDLRLSYAFSRSANQQTSATARAYARHVWLSSEARDLAPTSSNSDFASQIFEVGLNHQRRLGNGTFSARADLGWTWFSGDLSTRYDRVNLGYATAVSDTVSANFSAEVQRTHRQGTAQRTNTRRVFNSGLRHVTQNGNRITGNLNYATQSSESINERFESLTLQIGYTPRDPVGPMLVSVSGGVTYSHYPDYFLFGLSLLDGRKDTLRFANVTTTFPDINYAGFVPVVTFGYQDTESNVSRFERDEYSVNFGLRSSF